MSYSNFFLTVEQSATWTALLQTSECIGLALTAADGSTVSILVQLPVQAGDSSVVVLSGFGGATIAREADGWK